MTSNIQQLPPPEKGKTTDLKNPLGLLVQITGVIIFFWVTVFKKIYQIFVPIEPKDISGQVVLISGAGRGLGKELAIQFQKQGCRIACAEIQTQLNEETVKFLNEVKPGSAKGYHCDVGNIESVEQLKKQVLNDFGRVDILVNNAGIIAGGSILNPGLTPKLYENVTKVNFLSHIWMSRTFLPEMIERNSGHIVSISSMSSFAGVPNASIYTACKWAVNGFMESIREELRNKNPNNKVQVTVPCPYFINTSEHYTKSWECRFPELTVEFTAKQIVKGIRENQYLFSIPKDQYYAANFVKLLPQEVKDKFMDVCFAKVQDVQKEEVQNLPNYRIATGELTK